MIGRKDKIVKQFTGGSRRCSRRTRSRRSRLRSATGNVVKVKQHDGSEVALTGTTW